MMQPINGQERMDLLLWLPTLHVSVQKIFAKDPTGLVTL